MSLVYAHRRKDNGKIFYIGMGVCEKRANRFSGRNRYWNKKNDLKLNLKNCQYEYALLEDLTHNLKSQVKSVPFIYVIKDGHIVGQFEGGLRMKLNVTEEELQQFIDRINNGQ